MTGQILNAIKAQNQPQPVGLQVAQPINDVQLVALVAAQIDGSFQDAHQVVSRAMDLVAQSIVQMEGGRGLAARVQQLQRERREAN